MKYSDKLEMKYGNIQLTIYEDHNGKSKVNIANEAENITISLTEARYLTVLLLGARSEIMEAQDEA